MRKDNADSVTADSDLSDKTIGILKGAEQEKTFPCPLSRCGYLCAR